MYLPRLTIFVSLCFLAAAQDTNLAEVKQAFVDADIPNDLTITFDPTILLEVSLPQASGAPIAVKAGVQLPRNSTAGPATFALGPGSARAGNGPFVIAAVDPDAPTPQNPTSAQIRHFLGGSFNRASAKSLALVNSTAAITGYRQPNPPFPSDAHRYVFLLFRQSPEFATQTLVNSSSPVQLFNISSFADTVNLGDPIAGTFFRVAPNPPS